VRRRGDRRAGRGAGTPALHGDGRGEMVGVNAATRVHKGNGVRGKVVGRVSRRTRAAQRRQRVAARRRCRLRRRPRPRHPPPARPRYPRAVASSLVLRRRLRSVLQQ
jgi:hypothetical protein